MALAQDKQKEYSDKRSRGNLNVFRKGDLVLLDTKNLPLKVVSSVESNKLKHRVIGPFAVLARHGAVYTIDLPKSMTTRPTFYVGRLKRYHDPLGLPSRTEEDQGWYPRESYDGYDGTEWEEIG
ncbi:Pol protein [Phytophthora palmivora]|uniref:Pol protein n=1 Tax=Phytophthora palmivora TaxID=4796 RepID=A0A2P4XHS0_9STRA|nr:Pol protein [Phytophthora palmivora]